MQDEVRLNRKMRPVAPTENRPRDEAECGKIKAVVMLKELGPLESSAGEKGLTFEKQAPRKRTKNYHRKKSTSGEGKAVPKK